MTSPNSAPAVPPVRPRIDVGEAFAGSGILLLGGTGFLGKVVLSMLLTRFPRVRRVYAMVRAHTERESHARFWDLIENSPAFAPLRERRGAGLREFVEEKVVVLGGDITHDRLGYSEERAAEVAADIDLVLNCSGRVTFNPPLEASIRTNVHGTENSIAFARRMGRPALVHISTCFVAGNRAGEIHEDEPLIGYFPRRDREDQEFRVEREIEDCARLADRVRDEARDKSRVDAFREAARKRFREEGRDPDDARQLRLAIARERKDWIRRRLRDLGIEKAQGWGWPNIYTYTKSLGDQLVASASGVVRSIVRPAIVESAISFPHPGWNEGFTTSAPLVRMALRGQNVFPVDPEVVLDVVPVDLVASATLAVSAEALVSEPHLVYQVASGDRNPARIGRIVDLVGLYKRRHFREKQTGAKLWNEALGRMEARTIAADTFEKTALRLLRRSTGAVRDGLDRAAGEPIGPLRGLVANFRRNVESFEDFVSQGERQYHTFKPFIAGERFIFRADHTHELFSRLDGNDGRLFFNPDEIDWYDYWLHVHLPGLQKWVFPALDDAERRRPRRAYTYRTIPELFEACTKNHAGRIAMRIERGGREERYTYRDLRECVLRAAVFLRRAGLGPGDHIGLLGPNSPEWGMAYLAIARIGAVALPLDRDLRREEIVRLLAAGDAAALLVSPDLHGRHFEGESSVPDRSGDRRSIPVHPFAEVFAIGDEAEEARSAASLPRQPSPHALASILFTSGTTGKPKGVMLTHRNFTTLVSKLLAVYDISQKDGALSILPLHHSFEFTTGFLLPLSRGAQIAYLDEIGPDSLTRELKKGNTTCIVGVPALWDLLRRRILAPFSSRSRRAGDLVTALIDAAHLLREDTGVNVGPALFLPVHTALGGRIRYLISGAAALSETTWKTFRGLGFHIAQGYGLTEAAPVLTVTPPEGAVPIGSAGQALPGIKLRIVDPDASGVGEVVAKGPNVMAGYYGDPDATAEALRDGWLHTGDLGRLDDDGHLFLVGRRKDVIVDRGGKNVYPDEIEELYRAPALVVEMGVVGFPDGPAEQVAAVVVAKDDTAAGRKKVREHFRAVSSRLAFHKRVKVIEFHRGELPRTATRKVKRAELARWLVGTRRDREAGSAETAALGARLAEIVASISERSPEEVRLASSFAELGFDSLMYNELAAALESEFGEAIAPEALAALTTLDELEPLVREGGRGGRPRVRPRPSRRKTPDEAPIPPAVARMGRRGLTELQRRFYLQVLEPTFTGRAHVPVHTHFLAVANHASHLDMGLVKFALGDAGKNLIALAAADYFFDNRVKRTFFNNFTNLVPMERRGSLRESLDLAAGYLKTGHNVLVFPEGTRSRSGEVQPFRRGFAHLAFRCRVGVLPIHLDTHRAFPPGAVGLRSRKVAARIGPYLSREFLESLAGPGMRSAVRDQRVADLVQLVVERLGRGEPVRLHELRAASGTGGGRRAGSADPGRVPVGV